MSGTATKPEKNDWRFLIIVFVLWLCSFAFFLYEGNNTAKLAYCKGYIRGILSDSPCPNFNCSNALLHEIIIDSPDKMCRLAQQEYNEREQKKQG